MAAYFASLTVLDPLAAVLLVLRRRARPLLAGAVLAADAAANGDANSALDTSTGSTASRVGQAVITLLALALLAATPRLWPWMWPMTRHRQPNVQRTSQQLLEARDRLTLPLRQLLASSVVGSRRPGGGGRVAWRGRSLRWPGCRR